VSPGIHGPGCPTSDFQDDRKSASVPSRKTSSPSVRLRATCCIQVSFGFTEDKGKTVKQSRLKVVKKFAITEKQLDGIEQEGIAKDWPPL
jgi:hypothetical protein